MKPCWRVLARRALGLDQQEDGTVATDEYAIAAAYATALDDVEDAGVAPTTDDVCATAATDFANLVSANGGSANALRDVLMGLHFYMDTELESAIDRSSPHSLLRSTARATLFWRVALAATSAYISAKTVGLAGVADAPLADTRSLRACVSWGQGTVERIARGLLADSGNGRRIVGIPDATSEVSMPVGDENSHDNEATGTAWPPSQCFAATAAMLAASLRALLVLCTETMWSCFLHATCEPFNFVALPSDLRIAVSKLLETIFTAVTAAAATATRCAPLAQMVAVDAEAFGGLEAALAAAADRDAAAVALSAPQRAAILQRRAKAAEAARARRRTEASGALSDWKLPSDVAAMLADVSTMTRRGAERCWTAACGVNNDTQHGELEMPCWDTLTRLASVITESGRSAAIDEPEPNPDVGSAPGRSRSAAKRIRAYEKWTTKSGVANAVAAHTDEETAARRAAAEAVIDSATDRDPTAVGRAMRAMESIRAIDDEVEQRYADLWSSSDSGVEDEDDDDDTGAGVGAESTTAIWLVGAHGAKDTVRRLVPPVDAGGLLGVGALDRCGGISKAHASSYTPAAELLQLAVPAIAMLRQDSAHCKALGLRILAPVLLRCPRNGFAVDLGDSSTMDNADDSDAPFIKFVLSEAIAGAAVQDSLDRYAGAVANDPRSNMLFALAQEVVNVTVTCPAERLRKFASLLVPCFLAVLEERLRLRLLVALIRRCPYPSGGATLVAHLKREVEVAVASLVRRRDHAAAAAAKCSHEDLAAVARTSLLPPHRSVFISPFSSAVITGLAGRWAASRHSINSNADQLIAAINLVRYALSADVKFLICTMFDGRGGGADGRTAAAPLQRWLAAAMAGSKNDTASDGWPVVDVDAGARHRGVLDAFMRGVTQPVADWLRRNAEAHQDAADGQQQQKAGALVCAASAEPMALFALQSAVEGLTRDATPTAPEQIGLRH